MVWAVEIEVGKEGLIMSKTPEKFVRVTLVNVKTGGKESGTFSAPKPGKVMEWVLTDVYTVRINWPWKNRSGSGKKRS